MYQFAIIMKTFYLILITILFSTKLFAQLVPSEDYIVSNISVANYLTGNGYASYKQSSIFFNNKVVALTINGLKKDAFYFKIFSKRNDAARKEVKIVCYSNDIIKQYPDSADLKKKTPALTVTINYRATVNDKPYVDVVCYFYAESIRLRFGLDAHSATSMLPAIKRKYSPGL
jgi:hypothetical protein